MLGAEWERNETEKKMCKALEKVAQEVGAKSITSGMYNLQSLRKILLTSTSVAIAYVMQKAPHVFPIIGGRKVEHLMSNIEALDITLKPENIQYIDSVVPFNPGWPFIHFVRTKTCEISFFYLRVTLSPTTSTASFSKPVVI